MNSKQARKMFQHWLVRTALLTLFAFLFGVLTGCTEHEARRNDTVFVALSASPATLDPRFSTDASGMGITSLIFDSIVRLGPDLQIVGDAAKSWSFKDNVYTFELRRDLKFADGRPITPEDLKFTFEQYQEPRCPYSSVLKVIESVSIESSADVFRLQLKLSKFSATFLTDLSPVKILPRATVLALGDDFGRNPMGSGPYQFVSQSPNEIRLKARKEFARETPKTENLVLKIVRDDSTRFYKMLKGEIDIAQAELPPSKVSAFTDSGKYHVHKKPGLAMTYLLVNLRDPLLKHKAVREAISLAINRSEIIRYKLEGLGEEATSILTPGNPFFDTTLKNTYDLEKAKALLKQTHLANTELVLKTSNKQSVIETARVIAHQLEQIGFKVKLQSFEWGTFYDDVKKGNFQLAQMKWVGATDPDIYRIAFHSGETPPGRNRGYYLNPTLDRLMDAGLRDPNVQGRLKTYLEVQRKIHEDLPLIPLWYDTQIAIVNARVHDYTLSQNGDFSSLTTVRKESAR